MSSLTVPPTDTFSCYRCCSWPKSFFFFCFFVLSSIHISHLARMSHMILERAGLLPIFTILGHGHISNYTFHFSFSHFYRFSIYLLSFFHSVCFYKYWFIDQTVRDAKKKKKWILHRWKMKEKNTIGCAWMCFTGPIL